MERTSPPQTEGTLRQVKAVLLDDTHPRPVLFLGAGASVKSGIPAVGDLIHMIARFGYCRGQGWDYRDRRPQQSDWIVWLKNQAWHDVTAPWEVTYPTLVEKVLQPRQARKDFFSRALREGCRPSSGYNDMGELIAKGWIRTVLTTNFDDLVYQMCRGLPGAAQIEAVKSPSEAHLISTDPSAPQVVHIHGTVEHYTDCNLEEETRRLHPAVRRAISPLLKDHPLIVIGYRGAEPSVMQDLLIGGAADAGNYPHGIYWCVRESESELHPNLAELARTVRGNLIVVRIRGFDEAMAELNAGVGPSGRLAPPGPPRTQDLVESNIDVGDLDQQRIMTSLPVAARNLGYDVPSAPNKDWHDQMLSRLNLTVDGPDGVRPTRAGELLFSTRRPSAVEFVWAGRRRIVTGNILELLDEIIDLLAGANPPFRLKGPTSVDVRPYPPLALKELLVNALSHRDHDDPDPVAIRGDDDWVAFHSPGGVVDGVDAAMLGRQESRGYRNPVIANFLYGTGAMDKFGSGLIHVREWTQEVGGDAEFAVLDGGVFRARIRARPERPEPGGTLARPAGGYEIFYANALPVRFPRGFIDVGPSEAENRSQVFERHPGEQTAPFKLHGGTLLSLSDLTDQSNPLSKEIVPNVAQVAIADFCRDPEDERIVVELLNESLRRHARNRGMLILHKDQRLYFPKTESGERRILYHGRTRDATRTVVKVRRRSGSDTVSYFEHHAVHWRFRRFGNDWYLLLVPGWVFTRDGEQSLIDPRRTTSLSTRRAARDYNPGVSAHLFFWAAALTGDDIHGTVMGDGGGTIILEHAPLAAHLAGVPSSEGVDDPHADSMFEGDIAELEAELEDLADEPFTLDRTDSDEAEG